jgi:hypothetical protein
VPKATGKTAKIGHRWDEVFEKTDHEFVKSFQNEDVIVDSSALKEETSRGKLIEGQLITTDQLKFVNEKRQS